MLKKSIVVPIVVLALDQLTKYLAEIFLSSINSFPVIQGIFHLTLVHNRGIAFGLLKGANVFFIVVSILCIAAIIFLLRKKELKIVTESNFLELKDKVVRFSLGLVLGGAIGNLIDRLRFFYVIDFLDFRVWPVFNVADSAITVGGIIICWRMLKK